MTTTQKTTGKKTPKKTVKKDKPSSKAVTTVKRKTKAFRTYERAMQYPNKPEYIKEVYRIRR